MDVFLVEIDHGSYDKNETLGVAVSVDHAQSMCGWRAAIRDDFGGEQPDAPMALAWRRTPVAGGEPRHRYIQQWFADAASGGVFVITQTPLVGSRLLSDPPSEGPASR